MADIFIIKKPLITEKATDLSKAGKYVFIVGAAATKSEVRKAVREIYRVDAVKVNIVNLPRKPKRFRGLKSYKGGVKKAIVTLKEGQKIDLG
jgi:large subunit ribosomal protein L23